MADLGEEKLGLTGCGGKERGRVSVYVPMQVVFPVREDSQNAPNKGSLPPAAATSSSSSRLVPSAHELLALASRKRRTSPRRPDRGGSMLGLWWAEAQGKVKKINFFKGSDIKWM
ncbi:unnamed protein product [Cuscuta epithymum]|uniref:Uncharacterized protein n=1 Tax=Cuscuta epithymum TaxID=186058 RepID=A0AAV0EMP5_9ASTE|nr:unnamed protein product [Cuscuta epithymum]